MAQWVNRLRNKSFVNAPPLPLLCEISGALHLAQPGLTAGWLAGWQAGWQAGRLALLSTTVLNDIYIYPSEAIHQRKN